MTALSRSRWDGPLRRRWRARQWLRRRDLADRLRLDVTRSVDVLDGPDWLGVLYAEQLGRELSWADADLIVRHE